LNYQQMNQGGKMKVIARLAPVLLVLLLSVPWSAPISAQEPLQGQIPQTGSLGTHDPTLFKDGSTYYVAATGATVRSAPSLGGPWSQLSGSVPKAPWTNAVSGGGYWAPHVVKVGDTFYMYYSQSNFGTNNSAIGVKTTQTPGVNSSWVDYGQAIIRSGAYDPNGATHNAIDPAVHQDETGQWWIVWGSHFDGIMIQRLQDMFTPVGEITMLAHRGSEQFPVTNPNFNRLEGPVIFKRANYYYLITAWDWCCRSGGGLSPADNTYKVVIGRSEQINGPYVDKNGIPLAQGGGSIILNSRIALPGVTPTGLYRAPGGVDVFIENDIYYIVYHVYRPQTTLAIRSVDWHDGWPYFNEPGGGSYDLRDGAYYRLVNQDGIITNPNSLQNPVASNRCLTATADGGTPNVIQAVCSTSMIGEQVWQLERKFDGFYRLRSLIDDQSYCLAMTDSSGAIGTNVLVTPCQDSDDLQQWYFDDTGHGFHRPVVKQANLALEVENVNGVVGTNVVGGYRRDGDHQAGNLTQAAKWPPQQWRLSMVHGPVIIGTPANQTVEATGPNGAATTFATPTALDAVDGALPVTCTPASASIFPLGATTVTCSSTDNDGNTTSTTFAVTVVDTTPPTLSVSPTPHMLWPPNHKLVTVQVTASVADIADPNPVVTLLSATSNEPDSGLDSEDIPNDIGIINDQTFQLRAERSDQGNGRIYTITYEATDASGNSTTATATVTVPLNQGIGSAGAASVTEDDASRDESSLQIRSYLPFVQQ
jgi:hypothetical protein